MPIRSMTAFASVKGQAREDLGFSLALKSVNHRFLDLHLRMPGQTDALEMKIRRFLKENLARGHVELVLSVEKVASNGFTLNRELVSGYIGAFRSAAKEFGISAEPDLNAVLRLPGAMGGSEETADEQLDAAVLAKLEEATGLLNAMRDEEGRGIERELRQRMAQLQRANS